LSAPFGTPDATPVRQLSTKLPRIEIVIGDEEEVMRIVRSVNFLYTLSEDDEGSFILDLVIPAAKNAWANYEKRVVLSFHEKILIRAFPERADRLATKLIEEEKRWQQGERLIPTKFEAVRRT
jgi:hypothetical protein